MPWKERAIAAWPSADAQKGDAIAGKILRTEANVNAKENDPNPLTDYILDANGIETRVWGAKLLNLQLTKRDIGKEVKITFDGFGKAQKGKNAPKLFRVEVNE